MHYTVKHALDMQYILDFIQYSITVYRHREAYSMQYLLVYTIQYMAFSIEYIVQTIVQDLTV